MSQMPVILTLHSLCRGFSLWEDREAVPNSKEQAGESEWGRPASI